MSVLRIAPQTSSPSPFAVGVRRRGLERDGMRLNRHCEEQAERWIGLLRFARNDGLPAISPKFISLLGSRNESNPASLAALAMRLYRDFHILIECGEHPQQLLHRNQLQLAPQELG